MSDMYLKSKFGYCPICDRTEEFYTEQTSGHCVNCGHHLDLSEVPQNNTNVGDSVEIPETLAWCRSHYCPPVQTYINCSDFGHADGMDGSCWWCMEMTPYQWHMCRDESWIIGLLSPDACIHKNTREEAIEFVKKYKQNNPRPDERKMLNYEEPN